MDATGRVRSDDEPAEERIGPARAIDGAKCTVILRVMTSTLLLLLLPAPGRASEASGDDLVRAARVSAERARDKSMDVSMTLERKSGAPLHRSLRGVEKQTGEGRKILWVFDSPADLAGTMFLAWQQPGARELLWVYFPAQRRVRQVTDQMRRERFQGSDFTYEDLASILYFDYEGEHSLLRDEPCDASICAVVESKLVPGRSAYRRLRSWLRRDVPLPYRIEFYVEDKVKEVQVLEVGTIGEIPTILAMRARHVGDVTSTTVRFSDVRYNSGIADETFSLAALQHGK